jgi:hypothetical protein
MSMSHISRTTIWAVGRPRLSSRRLRGTVRVSTLVALTLALSMVASIASAEVFTDKWEYGYGETVQVTGDGMLPGEHVSVDVSFPDGTLAQNHVVAADEIGNFADEFSLEEGMPSGIYLVAATGLSSGNVFTVEFDPASHAINGSNPNSNNRPWFRTTPIGGGSGFDVTISGTYQCSSGGTGNQRCASPSSVDVTLRTSDGAGGTATGSTIATKTDGSLSGGTWDTTFEFRASPGAGQFAIPTDRLVDVHTLYVWNVSGGGTASETKVSDDHLGIDNTAPDSTVSSVTGGGSASVSASGSVSDNLSGFNNSGDPKPVHVEIRSGTPSGSALPGTTDDVTVSGGGVWNYATASGPTDPGSYCVVTSARDRAGNVETSLGSSCYEIAAPDGTAPEVTITITTNGGAPNGNAGWFVTDVSGDVSATDADSNISSLDCTGVSLTGVTGAGTAKSASGDFTITDEGTTSISCTATDAASNTSAPSTTDVMIDSVAPSITLTTPPDGASYALNQPVAADYGCADATSTIDSCVGDVADGLNIDTGSVGAKAFPVEAQDQAGNTASTTHEYDVAYVVSGFFQPIDNDAVNAAKAGQAIPVKWRVTDYFGVGISSTSSFVSVSSSIGAGACGGLPSDAIEDYAGSSGLQYLGNGYWQYNWKTPKSYVGQCRTMKLNLAGDQQLVASFQLK